MTDKVPYFYELAVDKILPGVISVDYPIQRGRQNNLLFVKTKNGDYVAKFNTRDMVFKNRLVSNLASKNGILTPDISAAGYNDVWFEYYPMIKGKTLFERMNDGMSDEAIKRAFNEILVQFSYMDKLPTKQISATKCIHIDEATYEHGKNANGIVMANIAQAIVYLMNLGKKHNAGLYHSDITPKNVIVDENGALKSFLDIDSMAICNRSFAFSVFADKWATAGLNLNEMYDKYEELTGREINRSRINTMLKAVHAGKFILFHTRKDKTK